MDLPTIAILLCTYQGERFLAKQLDSIAKQTCTNWVVYVSDDGSTDHTLTLLKKYAGLWGDNKLFLFQGPQRGFAANFFSLIHRKDITADFIAFADQDDIWETNKLARAIDHLQRVSSPLPGLYCSRTRLIDEEDRQIGFTTLYTKSFCFKNALVQNIAGGNTMVLNRCAHLLLQATPLEVKLPLHDWWVYLMVTGCGGTVMYDAYPSVRYRQHAHNQIGANQSYLALLFRIKLLLKGQFASWNEMNMQALTSIEPLLTHENQLLFRQYRLLRQQSLIPRLSGIIKSGVFRQTLMGNIKLLGAALLKKI